MYIRVNGVVCALFPSSSSSDVKFFFLTALIIKYESRVSLHGVYNQRHFHNVV